MSETPILDTLRALAELAVNDDDLVETAEGVVALACETLDCQHAGLTVFRAGGSFETLAPTGPLVSEADNLQYQLGEGPCVEAAWEEETFVSNDLSRDPRYPNWGPKAAAMGFGSLLAARLSIGGNTIGALNLYATDTREYTADDRDTAVIFASHAAATIMTVRERENLKEAVEGRTLIGQAQGILMERFDLDANRSFAVLRRFSQTQNIKLRQVAEMVIENGALPELES